MAARQSAVSLADFGQLTSLRYWKRCPCVKYGLSPQHNGADCLGLRHRHRSKRPSLPAAAAAAAS